MLQQLRLVNMCTQPLVTDMALSYETIIKSMAAKFLAHASAESAAQAMYEAIENSLSSDGKFDDRRKFWEDVIKEMTSIDQEFSVEVAELYFKLVVKTYGLPKP